MDEIDYKLKSRDPTLISHVNINNIKYWLHIYI